MNSGKAWTFSTGAAPDTVTVYERRPGGPVYARLWDPMLRDGKGDHKRLSLGP